MTSSPDLRRITPRARLALTLGLLAMVLLGISVVWSLPSATLQVVCRHGFRSAEITVSIDDTVVHTDTVTGAVRKRLGVFEQTQGTYATAFPVRAGDHVVTVRLRAPGYDHTQSVPARFSRGKQSTLSVDSDRGLSLAWRGTGREGGAAEPVEATSPWMRYTGSVLWTIFGSIVSASIGVIVQDLVRSRRARGVTARDAHDGDSKIVS